MTANDSDLRTSREDSRLVHEVTNRIRSMISGGLLEQGSRLHQENLAETLGVSRTPIREALLQLEREGLVVVDPRRGRFVKTVSNDDLLFVYEARLELEPVAARLGCMKATKQDRTQIKALQRSRRRGGGRPTAEVDGRLHLDLHRQLAAPCGNPIILEFLGTLWTHDDNHRLFRLRVQTKAELADIDSEHQEIIAAYLEGSGDRVEELMRAHIAARPPRFEGQEAR